MDIINSLASNNYLLYKNLSLGNTTGNVAVDVNGDWEIQDNEIVRDIDGNRVIETNEILDFMVNNVSHMPNIQYITEAIQKADNITEYHSYNKRLALDVLGQISDIYMSDTLVGRLSPELRADIDIMTLAVSKYGRSLQYASDELKDDNNIVTLAVNRDGDALQYASERLRDDKSLALIAIEKCKDVRSLVPVLSFELKADIDIMSLAINKDVRVFQYASEELRGNKEFVLFAINKIDGRWYITEDPMSVVMMAMNIKLRADKDIMLAVVSVGGFGLMSASSELRNDRELVGIAIRRNSYALQYASEELRNDKELAMFALERCADNSIHTYALIESLGDILKSDKEVMILAVNKDVDALKFASIGLKDDMELVEIAVRKKGDVLQHASDRLRDDSRLALLALESCRSSYDLVKSLSLRLRADKNFMLAAINENGLTLEHASENLRSDKELALRALENIPPYSDGQAFNNLVRSLSVILKADKEVVLQALKHHSSSGYTVDDFLYIIDGRFMDDKEVMLLACQKLGYSLRSASKRLQDDKDVVLAAITQDRNYGTTTYNLKYASERLRNDEEIILTAVNMLGYSLQFASQRLRDDRNIVNSAVSSTGKALEFASPRLQNDREIVLTAISNASGGVLEFASRDLRDDTVVVENALAKSDYDLVYASDRFRNNRELVLAILKKGKRDGFSFELIKDIVLRFKDDKEIIKLAVAQSTEAIYYISASIINDEEFNTWLRTVNVLDKKYLDRFNVKAETSVDNNVQITIDNYAVVVPALLAQGQEQKVLDAFMRLGYEAIRYRYGNDGWGGAAGYQYTEYSLDPEKLPILRHCFSLLPNPDKLLQIISIGNSSKEKKVLYFEYLVLTRMKYNHVDAYIKLIELNSLAENVNELIEIFSSRYYRSPNDSMEYGTTAKRDALF